MKHLDAFSRRFLAVSLGLAALLVALAIFLQSIPAAYAQQSAEPPYIELPTGAAGPFQIDLAVESTSQGVEYRAVVINTRTAASRYYQFNPLARTWELHPRQIPTEAFQ